MQIEQELTQLLIKKKWTLSLAESCTGGGIAARLVKIPDCSNYFLGGVVAYSNFVKSRLLGVSPLLLKEHGVVSDVVALAMARGAKQQFNADLALSVTGIAGPSGGNIEKPVGTVYFHLFSPTGDEGWKKKFTGSRSAIIDLAIEDALDHLLMACKR